jgi:hypothetical protein
MFQFSIYNIIIGVSIVLLICLLYFIIVIPHYDDSGKFVFFGKYKHIDSLKVQEHEKYIKGINNNYTELEEKYKKVYNQNEDIINKNIELKESNNEYVKRLNMITSKLNQQESFYKEQLDSTKENYENKLSKHSFSKVSKKEYNNDRPNIGSIYNKNIKS